MQSAPPAASSSSSSSRTASSSLAARSPPARPCSLSLSLFLFVAISTSVFALHCTASLSHEAVEREPARAGGDLAMVWRRDVLSQVPRLVERIEHCERERGRVSAASDRQEHKGDGEGRTFLRQRTLLEVDEVGLKMLDRRRTDEDVVALVAREERMVRDPTQGDLQARPTERAGEGREEGRGRCLSEGARWVSTGRRRGREMRRRAGAPRRESGRATWRQARSGRAPGSTPRALHDSEGCSSARRLRSPRTSERAADVQ